jgi:acyl-CoA thioesterase
VIPSFDDVIRWAPDGDGWVGAVPEAWMQGRGAFGGVVCGVAVRALEARVDRPLRSIDGAFLGPLRPGVPGRVEARVLRAGRSITFAEATVSQQDRVVARFSAALGDARPSGVVVPGPTLEHPPDALGVPFEQHPGVPQFITQLQMRLVDGRFPFTGQTEPGVSGWCRFREAATGTAGVLALADAWPPPVLSMLTRPAPASTVRWSSHIVGPVSDAHAGDWFYRSRCVHAADGYTVMVAELFDPEDRLVVWSEQLAAVFDG